MYILLNTILINILSIGIYPFYWLLTNLTNYFNTHGTMYIHCL